MLFSGLLLTFGSMFGIPLIGLLASFLLGENYIDKILNSNAESLPIILIVSLVAVVGLPIIGSILLFGAFLIPLFSNMRAKNKIIAQGKDAEAKILALADTGTRINNNPLVNFTLEVHPQMSPPFQAVVSQTVSVIHLPSYQPGKIVHVKYMPGTNEVTIIGAKFV
jgi:hypothetical protein